MNKYWPGHPHELLEIVSWMGEDTRPRTLYLPHICTGVSTRVFDILAYQPLANHALGHTNLFVSAPLCHNLENMFLFLVLFPHWTIPTLFPCCVIFVHSLSLSITPRIIFTSSSNVSVIRLYMRSIKEAYELIMLKVEVELTVHLRNEVVGYDGIPGRSLNG